VLLELICGRVWDVADVCVLTKQTNRIRLKLKKILVYFGAFAMFIRELLEKIRRQHYKDVECLTKSTTKYCVGQCGTRSCLSARV